jgi:hypothetical protein
MKVKTKFKKAIMFITKIVLIYNFKALNRITIFSLNANNIWLFPF